ncbi:hypothetical protein BCR44DRAFT_48723 [Catenaria anguillulae PL171]|uniref:HECT domain-containing protein n=1 Tax=Catenaria anguillulae PL171 TaxID=765915 RepID=A0A1Y2HMQ8_9FUNG|nr:hypothetical protein BCR44DRAFT_48723 [Catenaria anguillulae PL171]
MTSKTSAPSSFIASTPLRRSSRIASTPVPAVTPSSTSLSQSLSQTKRGGRGVGRKAAAALRDLDSDSDLSSLSSSHSDSNSQSESDREAELSDIGDLKVTRRKSSTKAQVTHSRKRKLPASKTRTQQQGLEPPTKRSRHSAPKTETASTDSPSRAASLSASTTTSAPLGGRRRSARFTTEQPSTPTAVPTTAATATVGITSASQSQSAVKKAKTKAKAKAKATARNARADPSASSSSSSSSSPIHDVIKLPKSSTSKHLQAFKTQSTPKANTPSAAARTSTRASTRRTRSSSSSSAMSAEPTDPTIQIKSSTDSGAAATAADSSAMDVDPPSPAAAASSAAPGSSAASSSSSSAPAAGDTASPTTPSAATASPLSPLSALAAALSNASASGPGTSSTSNPDPSSPNSILTALLNSASAAGGGPLSPTSQSNAQAALLAAMQQAAASASSSSATSMFGGFGGGGGLRVSAQIRQLATTFKSLAANLSQAEDPTELYMALQQIPELVLMNAEDTLAAVCMCTQNEYANAAASQHDDQDQDEDEDNDEQDEDDEAALPAAAPTGTGPRNVIDHLVKRLIPLIAPTSAPTSDAISELAYAMLGTEVAVLAVRCVKALLDGLPSSGIAMLVRNRAPVALVTALGDVQYMDAADGVVDVVHHLVTGGVDGAAAASLGGYLGAGGATRTAQAALVDAGAVPVLVKYLDFLPLPSQRRAIQALAACISSAAGAMAFTQDKHTWRAVLHLVSAPEGVVDAQLQKAAVGVWMNVVKYAANVAEALMPRGDQAGGEETPLAVLAKLVRENREVTALLKVACHRDAAARAATAGASPTSADSSSNDDNKGVAHALVQHGVLDLLLSPPAEASATTDQGADDQNKQPTTAAATAKFTLTADHIALLTALVDAEVQSTPGSAGNADRAAQLVECLLDMPDEVPGPVSATAMRPTFASIMNRGSAASAAPTVAPHWSLLLHVVQRAVQAGNAGAQVVSPGLIDRVIAAIARGTVPKDHALPLVLVDAEPERCRRHGLAEVVDEQQEETMTKEVKQVSPESPKSPTSTTTAPAKKRSVRIDAPPAPLSSSTARIADLTAWEFMHLPWVQSPTACAVPTTLTPEDVHAAHSHIHVLIARHLTQLPLVFDPRVSLRGPGGALVSSQGGASGEVTPEIVLVGVRVNVVAPVAVADRMGMGVAFGGIGRAAAGTGGPGGADGEMVQSEVESEDDHHEDDEDEEDEDDDHHHSPDVQMDEDGEMDDEFDAGIDGDGDIAMHDVLPASASEAEDDDEHAEYAGGHGSETQQESQATEAVPDLDGAQIEPPTTPIIPSDQLASGEDAPTTAAQEEVEQVVEMGPFQIQAVARVRDVYRSLGIDMAKWVITHDGRALELDDAVFRPLWEHVQKLHREKCKADGKPVTVCPTEDVFRKQFRFQVVAKDKAPADAAAKEQQQVGEELAKSEAVAAPMCALLECAARLNAQYHGLGARPSAALVRHVQRQMNQVLLASTQSQPEWLAAVVQGHFPLSRPPTDSAANHQEQQDSGMSSWRFLVPFATRRHYYACHCLGYARCLLRVAPQAARLGKIPRQKVRIDRPHILSSAYRTFDLFGAEYSMLEIEYRGEVGTGLGPTLEFYSLTVQEIANRKDLWQTAAVPFLLPRGASVTDAEVDQVRAESEKPQVDKKMVPKDKLTHAHILFLLGQVMAKALMDDRTVDVPLHPAFLKLVFSQQPSAADMDGLRAVDPVVAKSMQAVLDMSDPSALHLHFEYDGKPLIPGGEDVPVNTAEDARRYVALVADRVAGVEGLGAAARCVRLGFERVLPVAPLASLFSADELLTLFSGSATEDNQYWTHQALLSPGGMQADHGYSLDSPAVRWLVDWMVALPASDRRTFLTFLTGAPRLPLGGWKALRPKFTVVHRSAPNPDTYLPSVMTCANYLKMPSYSSRELLDQRMRMAMAEGQGSFHLS